MFIFVPRDGKYCIEIVEQNFLFMDKFTFTYFCLAIILEMYKVNFDFNRDRWGNILCYLYAIWRWTYTSWAEGWTAEHFKI